MSKSTIMIFAILFLLAALTTTGGDNHRIVHLHQVMRDSADDTIKHLVDEVCSLAAYHGEIKHSLDKMASNTASGFPQAALLLFIMAFFSLCGPRIAIAFGTLRKWAKKIDRHALPNNNSGSDSQNNDAPANSKDPGQPSK